MSGENYRVALQFILATLSLCPFVSLLGAKRPQHRAWHFIVASLWAVLVIPAGSAILVPGAGGLELHVVRFVFTYILIAFGLINYLLTRFWAAIAIGTAGQLALFAPQLLPNLEQATTATLEIGSVLIALAVGVAYGDWFRPSSSIQGRNRTWRTFRDAYGGVWALRVQERLNATARKLDWKARLCWSGFVDAEEPSLSVTDLPEPMDRSFRMLLRRFVTSSWYC